MKPVLTLCLSLLILAAGAGLCVAQVLPGGLPGQQPPGAPGPGGPLFKDLVPALIDALKDDDRDVRQSAASALASMGRQAVPPLTDLLKDKEKGKELRANAAYVLGQMGRHAQDAVPALTTALKDDDADVRRRVAFALQRIVKDVQDSGGPGMMGGPGGGPPGLGGGGGVAFGGGGPDRGPRSVTIQPADPGLVLPGGARKEPEKKEEEKK